MLGEAFPERASCRPRSKARGDGVANAAGQGTPGGDRRRQKRLDAAADRLPHHRRRAIGGDADHHRRAVDDGTEQHIADLRLVDDIDQRPRYVASRPEGGDFIGIVAIEHGQRAAGEIGIRPAAPVQGEPPRRRAPFDDGHQLDIRRLGEHMNVAAGRREQLGLPGHRLRSTCDHHAPSRQIDEQRQPGKRLHAGRKGAERGACVALGHFGSPDEGLEGRRCHLIILSAEPRQKNSRAKLRP